MYLIRHSLAIFMLCLVIATGLSACGGKLLLVKGMTRAVKAMAADGSVTYDPASSYILVGMRNESRSASPSPLSLMQISEPVRNNCIFPVESSEFIFEKRLSGPTYILREVLPGRYVIGPVPSSAPGTFAVAPGHVYYLGNYILTSGEDGAPYIKVEYDDVAALEQLKSKGLGEVRPEHPLIDTHTLSNFPLCPS